ncbi:MAG: peroxide stress protein YaaA, partial [Actinobacteria bacterium]|nr:peroxide stress protein YaaA [Actinomycetota bacterium]
MLIVVSPAKSLDYESKLPTKKYSEPRMLAHSNELVGVMAKKSPSDISELMHVSASLGELNHERFQDWEMPFT